MPVQQKAKNRRPMKLETRNTLVGLSFIMPNFIGFFIMVLVPVVYSLVLSVMKWDGYNAMEFVGLENFTKMFGDRVFKAAMKQTFVFAFFTVVITMVLSLALAMLLNSKLKMVNFFRSAIFFPYVASVVAVGAVWKAMFSKAGPVNALIAVFGVSADKLPGWFASTKWAMAGVIIVQVWRMMGYYMIVYLAGLQDIPTDLYEAASIDGASKWQQFKSITLPLLSPSHFFVFMMLTINSFKTFDLIFALTEGGPGTSTTLLSQYIYNKAFVTWDYGGASAASIILFVIVGGITLIQFALEKRVTNYM